MVKIAFLEDSLEIPDDVEVSLKDQNIISIKGPKGGPITKDFSHVRNVKIEIEGKSKLKFASNFPRSKTIALAKTIKNLIKNLILGVKNGYTYKSKVCYSHFPITVEVRGNKIHIKNFNGERADRIVKIIEGVDVSVIDDDVITKGVDKEIVGQLTANLQRACRLRKKDKRVFQDGIFVYQKLLGDTILWQIR
jgi:large subunit ribosomal protein L6